MALPGRGWGEGGGGSRVGALSMFHVAVTFAVGEKGMSFVAIELLSLLFRPYRLSEFVMAEPPLMLGTYCTKSTWKRLRIHVILTKRDFRRWQNPLRIYAVSACMV